MKTICYHITQEEQLLGVCPSSISFLWMEGWMGGCKDT